jgi:hypothetical protein
MAQGRKSDCRRLMIARTNTASFTKQMNNIVKYSFGFLEGVDRGKKIFFDRLGQGLFKH